MLNKKIIRISGQNAEFQIIAALKNNRHKRQEYAEIFIEGIEAIKQALAAGKNISRFIFMNYAGLSGWAKEQMAAHPSARLIEMSQGLYRSLCDKNDPAELLVTVKLEKTSLVDLKIPKKPFIVIFDRPSDHGNFGTLVRTANAFNVDAVFVVGHGIDIYDPKVIRSSLGAVFHTPIVLIESMEKFENWVAEQKKDNGLVLVGSDSAGEDILGPVKLETPIALILGNEAKGMSLSLRKLSDRIVRIPLSGDVNSLNVACAGSILIWSVVRQEHAQKNNLVSPGR